jgi:hypothetical protein
MKLPTDRENATRALHTCDTIIAFAHTHTRKFTLARTQIAWTCDRPTLVLTLPNYRRSRAAALLLLLAISRKALVYMVVVDVVESSVTCRVACVALSSEIFCISEWHIGTRTHSILHTLDSDWRSTLHQDLGLHSTDHQHVIAAYCLPLLCEENE